MSVNTNQYLTCIMLYLCYQKHAFFYLNYRYTVKSMHLFKCVNTNCFSNLKYRYDVKSMHLFDLDYRYVIKSIHLFIKCVSSDCCFDLHYIGMSYKACVYLLIFRPSLFGYVMQRMLLFVGLGTNQHADRVCGYVANTCIYLSV